MHDDAKNNRLLLRRDACSRCDLPDCPYRVEHLGVSVKLTPSAHLQAEHYQQGAYKRELERLRSMVRLRDKRANLAIPGGTPP